MILLFVNDGSKDNTLEILKNITNLVNAKLINFERNQGKAIAVQTGVNELISEDVKYRFLGCRFINTYCNDIINL